jgi:hypothetical protein
MFRTNLTLTPSPSPIYVLILIPALTIALLSGCGHSVYGRLQSSRDVTQAFEESQIYSDHQYYYSGFQQTPFGIIGIDNNYQLRSSYWKPIDLNPALLNKLIYRMDTVYSLRPQGSWILDQQNKRVGIWYSSQRQTKVKVEKNNRIVVVPPEPPDLRGGP